MTKPELFLSLSFICAAIAAVFGAFLGYTLSQDPVNILHETLFGIFTALFMGGGIALGIIAFLIKEKFL